MRRFVARIATLVLLVGAGIFPIAKASAASVCNTSTPSGATYTVTVCIDAPADGATLTGDATTTASATVSSGGSTVQRMIFNLDGNYLLTDYQAPYTFLLPTEKFADGAHTLSVQTLMRDGLNSDFTSISLNFSNGNATQPQNNAAFVPTPGTDPAPGQPFVLAAVGDGAGGDQSAADVTNLIASWNPNLFFYLGDVYEKGSRTEYFNWYQPNQFFGRFRAITDPTIGNHEYTAGVADGYYDYWGNNNGNPVHYYSFDTHGWHVISLDANSAFNQLSPTSAQYQWLQNDLQTSNNPCTVVEYHQPLFNIGQEPSQMSLADIWTLLAQHHVPLVLNGHDHTYQRWTPLDANGNPSPGGITEIITGTGGHALGNFVTTDPRVMASATQFGATKLTLNPAGATYQFVTTSGQTLDSGSVPCNASQIDKTAPTTPTNLVATAGYKTRIDLSWSTSTDNVGVVGYNIYRDGSLFASIGPDTTYSDNTVTPGSTHSYEVQARDAAGNVSQKSNTASATTPTVAVLFHDGFETGDLSNWINPAPITNPTNNGLVADQTDPFAGSWDARSTSTGQGASAWHSVGSETNLYYVAHFKALSHSSSVTLMRFRNTAVAANSIVTLSLSTTNRITVRDDVTATSVTSTASAVLGAWHTVQFHLDTTNGIVEVWLDGSQLTDLSLSGANVGTLPIGRIELGDMNSATTPRSYDVLFDEVAYDRQYVDNITAPTAPTNLSASAHSGLRVDLSWTAATDDVGVAGYDVYRNGALIESIPPGTTYSDLSVTPLTSYTYQLVARDAAGNVSNFSNVAAVTTPEIFTDDFESGTLAKWTSVAGLADQSSVVDSGAFAARATSDGTAGASAQTTLDSTANELYYRLRFNIQSQGPNSVSLARLRTATNGALTSVFVASTGKLTYRNDTSATVTTTNQTVSKGLWHELQFHVLVNGDSSQVDLWLDGVQVITGMTDSLGTSPIGRIELGDPSTGRVFDTVFDNVVVGPAFLTDVTPPTAPQNLHATNVLTNEVDLAWDPATDDVGVIKYRVYRNGAPIADVDGSLGTYADTTAVDSTQYTYTVTAFDAVNQESAASNAVTVTTLDGTPPSAPSNLTAAPKPGVNEIDLSWSPATDNVGVAHYNIYRDGGSVPIATVDGTTLTYADATVAGASTHSYTVTAIDAALNEGPPSNTATATSWDTIKPNPPTLNTATALSDHEISLSWSGATDNVGVTGYKVYRGGTAIATLSAVTTYTDGAAPPATTSSYTVSALDAAGNESVVSNAVSATTYLFTDGFESGNLSKWTTVGGLAVTNAIHHTGLWGAQAQSQKNTADYASETLPSTYTEIYYRAWIQLQSGKPDTVDFMRLQTATGTPLVSLFYDSKGNLGMRDDVTNTAVISTSNLKTSTWYEAKVHLIINGTSSTVEVFLNGTKIAALSGTRNFGNAPIGRAILGENVTGHAYNVGFDDVWISRTAS